MENKVIDKCYTNGTLSIINSNTCIEEKVYGLCDFIIPKIMHIPKQEIDEIQRMLINFNISLPSNPETFPLVEIAIQFLEYRRSNFQNVIKSITRTVETSTVDMTDSNKAIYNVLLGTSYRSLGERDKALSSFQSGIELIDDHTTQVFRQYLYGIALYHIAEIYGELGDYRSMLERHTQFRILNELWAYKDMENRSLNGIGRAYLNLGDFDNALKYLKWANIKGKEEGNLPFRARNYNDLGEAYFKIGDYNLAIESYEKALKIRKDFNLENAVVTTLTKLGSIYMFLGKSQLAIEHLKEALHIAERLEVGQKLYQIYHLLASAYEEVADWKSSLTYFKKYHDKKEKVEDVKKTQVETQRIREANSKLKQQKKLIEEQKVEIERSVEKLQINNKYLENFASVAAHDLKAPIRVAAGFASLIRRKYKDVIAKEDIDYVNFIANNVAKLSEMIDDLLSLSKIDQNLPDAVPVDIKAVVDDVLKRLTQKVEQANAVIHVPEDLPTIIGHSGLVKQLFQNFIDNSIKYQKEGIQPKVNIGYSIQSDTPDYYTFSIKDNGQGISEDRKKDLFELFSPTKRKDSSGIGLATCKKIVSHYGGEIWVESTIGEGSTMFFSLPIYK